MSSEPGSIRLRELSLRITKGTTPTKGEGFVARGVNYIKSESITSDGAIDASKFAFIDFDTHKKLLRSQLCAGNVLFSMAGVYLGKTAVVLPEHVPANTNQAVGIITLDESKADPYFIHYSLQSPACRAWVLGSAAQSAQPNFNLQEIGDLKIPAFPLTRQKEIASFLRALDDRITLLRETNATLEAIAQALFKSWFVDFDPVRAKMEGRVPEGMDEATAALFPDSFEETELGEVPTGWHTDFIAPWLSVLETGRRPKGGVSGISDGIPSIGAESIVKVGQFDFSKLKFVSTEFFTAMKSGRLISRDVLLYKDGGKPGVFLPRVSMFGDGFPFDVCGINEHVFRIRLKEPFGQIFLYFWLWSDSVMHELKHRGGKAAIPGINQADVKELRLSVPSTAVLRRFEEICDPIVGKILNNAKHMQSLASLRDELLPRLISGQLRLPEAQPLAAEAV